MYNWEEIAPPIPQYNGTALYQTGASGLETVFLNGKSFINIDYEQSKLRDVHGSGFSENTVWRDMFGNWIVKKTNDAIYLSNDNVYFLKIVSDEEIYNIKENSDTLSGLLWGGSQFFIYENGDDIVIESGNGRCRLIKQPIYDELDRLKNAPYIKLNDTILGFDEPPVIENDRTLVPMRFLFEQMDAEVEWDGDSNVITITK